MRIGHLCLLLLVMTALPAVPTLADPYPGVGDYWSWQFTADTRDLEQICGGSRVILGFTPLASDGLDGEPPMQTVDGPNVYMAAYRTDWPGQPGFYAQDIRAPLLPGQTKKWVLYVWATPDVPGTCDSIELAMGNTMPLPPDAFGIQFDLALTAKPDSVTGGPDVGPRGILTMQATPVSCCHSTALIMA